MIKGRNNALNQIRRHTPVMAYVVLLIALVTLLFDGSVTLQGGEHERIASGETREQALPSRIRIPSLNVETSFEEPLGVTESREIEVPDSFEEVGWYKHGPTPGEEGPAVILGHVDSREGPAVFYSLNQLNTGESIYIEREDGVELRFEVTALKHYKQEGFPRELVYGDIDHAGLRLVTCSGTFDKGKQKYSHNLVVYAALRDSKE